MYNSGDGRLVGVPFADAYVDSAFDKADFGLRAAPRVGSYAGFVFASLSSDVESLEDHLGGVRRYLDLLIDSSPDRQLNVVDKGSLKYMVPANWKIQAENVLDGYHGPYTHETALKMDAESWNIPDGYVASFPHGHGAVNLILPETVELPDAEKFRALAQMPGGSDERGGALNISGLRGMSDQIKREYFVALVESHGPERAAEVLGAAGMTIYVFPNLYIQPLNQHYRVFRPIAADQTEAEIVAYRLCGASEAWEQTMLMKVNGWATALGFGQPEDVEVFASIQEALQARSVEWLDFSRGLHRERLVDGAVTASFDDETCMRGLHEEWLRLMSKEVV
jgi:phenylpropionate dioxygenase-like ring-hydroxylating dioxygenase large terminal subunit